MWDYRAAEQDAELAGTALPRRPNFLAGDVGGHLHQDRPAKAVKPQVQALTCRHIYFNRLLLEEYEGRGGYRMMARVYFNAHMAERLEPPYFAPVNDDLWAQHVVVKRVDIDDTLVGVGGERCKLSAAGGTARKKTRHQ